MFNSREINRDPLPFAGGRNQRISREEYLAIAPEIRKAVWLLDPRPEYDNNPNPILVNFRGVEGARPRLWLYMVQSDLIDPDDWLNSGHSVKHLEHAERVFKRMVSVYEEGIK